MYDCSSNITLLPYSFQFCGALSPSIASGSCVTDPASSSVSLYPGGCLQAYGSSEIATATPSKDGLVLKYTGKDQCAGKEGEPYYTQVNLRCDPQVTAGTVVFDNLVPSDTGCGLIYSGSSPAGCGADITVVLHPIGIVASVLTGLGAFMVLYFVLGTLWNRKTKGARGLEAVPHISFFRAVYRLTCDKFCRSICGGKALSLEEREAYEELRAGEEETPYFIQ